ncbi:MAG: TIGR01906 family membrane protein [Anaerolineaceae bacterium]|nr:TIGR01906 family membrane protein [Anaerolineaceae bacterium]
MNSFERSLQRGLTILVALLIPFTLLMGSIRLLMTDAFLQVEYHTPWFPPDLYGLTLEERLKWSKPSVDYLINNAGIAFLAELKFTDGTPIYNERELSHMQDVKNLVQKTLGLWRIGLIVLIALVLVAWRRGWGLALRRGLSTGGWITVGVVIGILVGVMTGFDWLFTEFHHLFFAGDTWLFLYSDTLIRLFPIRFWMDAFILVGVLCLAVGAALGWFLQKR